MKILEAFDEFKNSKKYRVKNHPLSFFYDKKDVANSKERNKNWDYYRNINIGSIYYDNTMHIDGDYDLTNIFIKVLEVDNDVVTIEVSGEILTRWKTSDFKNINGTQHKIVVYCDYKEFKKLTKEYIKPVIPIKPKYMFKTYLRDKKVMVLIKPIKKPDYDQHFTVKNDEFNQNFIEELECVWKSLLNLNDTRDFLKRIGMIENNELQK